MDVATEKVGEVDHDFAKLNASDEYARYFNLMRTAFKRLMTTYKLQEAEGNLEAVIVLEYVKKFLFTVEALRMKYTYSTTRDRTLWVDLTDSGFPNEREIAALSIDLLSRERRLQDLPVASLLRRSIIDALAVTGEDPPDLLAQLSERRYLEMIDETKLFLSFTPGVLELKNSNGTHRQYVISWACYDQKMNRPYIHIMYFDQDIAAEPLEKRGTSFTELMSVVKSEGSRVPDLGILAFAIDDRIDAVHPKSIKRICLGPLYSQLILGPRMEHKPNKLESAVFDLLKQGARHEGDFILWVVDEIIFSQRQTQKQTSKWSKVREIFLIPEANLECYSKRASIIHHTVILPHAVLQNLGQAERTMFPIFNTARTFVYDAKGVVNAI